MKTSVVIPSLNRPKKLTSTVASLLSTAPDVEVIVVLQKDDVASQKAMREFEVVQIITVGPECNGICGWNTGAQAASGDLLVLGADDLRFCDEWLEETYDALAKINYYGMVAFNDLSPTAGTLATHYAVTRGYAVNEWGGFLALPYYGHWGLDVEATYRAKRDQCFVYAQDAVVEHLHPAWNKAEHDATYEKMATVNAHGENIFNARKNGGFKNTQEPILTMRVADCEGWGRVAVGARVYKYPEPAFFISWTRLVAGGMRKGDILHDPAIGLPGHMAGNAVVREFLNTKCNSLLLIDDDMTFDADALEKLRSNEDNWDYDVVMGFCTHKTVPPHAVVMQLHDPQPGVPVSLLGEKYGALRDIPNNTVMDVDAIGLAFTLIKRHVLEAMVSEYGAIYTSWFDWGKHSEGEDIVFSRRCRELGYRLAVDTNVKIGHVGKYVFGWKQFHEWQAQEKNR